MGALLLLPKNKELLNCTQSRRAASKAPQPRQFLLISPIPLLWDDPAQHFQFSQIQGVKHPTLVTSHAPPKTGSQGSARYPRLHSKQTPSTCQRCNPQLKSSLIRSREASSGSSSKKQGRKKKIPPQFSLITMPWGAPLTVKPRPNFSPHP